MLHIHIIVVQDIWWNRKCLKNNGLNISMFVENDKPVGQRNSINLKHNKHEENHTKY